MASPRRLIEKLQEISPDDEIEWLVINKYGQVVSMSLKGDGLDMSNLLDAVAKLKSGRNAQNSSCEG